MEGDKRPNQDNKNDGAHHYNKHKRQPNNRLERFWVERNNPKHPQSLNNPEPPQNPDLDLSLRLGSIHHHENTTLARSSSLAGVMTSTKDSYSLKRSCSLPTDAEQLQRRTILRDLHTMSRKAEANKCLGEGRGKDKSPVPPKVAAWPPASSSRTRPTSSSTNFQVKEKHVSQTVTGTGLEGSATANAMVTPETDSNEKLLKPIKTETGNPFKGPRITHGNFEDNGMEIMRQMPSVSTTGDGPNGRKVEGFLYRYMKGHVSIMCVCHGSFLSPAEFVKHAGGRDVPNPMKHISVHSTFSV